jgi:hypothetical protein
MDGMAIVDASPPILMMVESGRVSGLWNLIIRGTIGERYLLIFG